MATMTPCPHCRTPAEFSAENPFRPFCSERCQLIDLGEWFNEERSIPGTPDTGQEFQSVDQNLEDH